MQPTSTIAAIATGPARAGIGIVRLSGPDALSAARSLAPGLGQPKPRYAHLLHFESEGTFLDKGLLLWFPAPASFTGEEVVELHLHGSPVLLRRLLRLLCRHPGVREALPGEFSQRAFLNGRMDLAQTEAVAALIESKTEAAAQAAAAQMAGHWSTQVARLRKAVVGLLAHAEACLDFPEETAEAEEALPSRLMEAYERAEILLRLGKRGQLLRQGARVVLYGPVNAGKSTLLNALLGFERALVDTEPGTTRDLVEAPMEWGGVPLVLVDTAGLREVDGGVEARGIEAAREAVAGADIALLVLPPGTSPKDTAAWRALAPPGALLEVYSKADLAPAPEAPLFPWEESSTPPPSGASPEVPLSPWEESYTPPPAAAPDLSGDTTEVPGIPGVASEVSPDVPTAVPGIPGVALGILPGEEGAEAAAPGEAPGERVPVSVEEAAPLRVSAHTGENMALLSEALQQRLGGETAQAVAACSLRQRAALETCSWALESAVGASAEGHPLELVAAHLQLAQEALGQLLGESLAPEVLDEVFRQFCLGK